MRQTILIAVMLGGGVQVGLPLRDARAAEAACAQANLRLIGQIYDKARVQAGAGRWVKAIALLEAARKVATQLGCARSKAAARTLVLLGLGAFFHGGDEARANSLWRQALAIWPGAQIPPVFDQPKTRRAFRVAARGDVLVPRSASAASPPPPRPGPKAAPEGRGKPGSRPRPHGRPRTAPFGRLGMRGASSRMPQDASLYGLGSRFAWRELRRAKRRNAIGWGLMAGGLAGALGFPLASIPLFIKDTTSWSLPLAYTLLGLGGACFITMFVGIGIEAGQPAKISRTGLMIFSTERGGPVSLDVSPGGVTVSGGF